MSAAAPKTLLAFALLATAAPAQTEPIDDWSQHVARACTAQRYGLRLAAAKKVGRAGEAAVPAVRAYAKANGADTLPVALVEAMAEDGGDGEQVLALMREWATDRDFYWRAQALRGLVLRAERDLGLRNRLQPVFAELRADPAWLVRVHARHGQSLMPRDFTAAEAQALSVPLPESDPRAEVKFAALGGDLPTLYAALGDERTFLGDTWGHRRATEALGALKKALGTDCGLRLDAPFDSNRKALDDLATAIATKQEGPAPACERRVDAKPAPIGGIEFLSCRNGDLFLTWTADGLVRGGADPECRTSVQIPPTRWAELLRTATALDLPVENGVVVCDRIRFWPRTDRPQVAAAPHALPPVATGWLKQLAAAIEEADSAMLADAVRDRLTQFEAPTSQSRETR